MLVPAAHHSDGARQAGAPRAGRRRPPRSPEIGGTQRSGDPGAAHGAQGRSAQPGRPPALAAEAAPELRASPAAGLGCPGAPSSRRGVGELRLAEKRPARPVPDAQNQGGEEQKKKDAERGALAVPGLATLETLPKPSNHLRPAGRGHSERHGRRGWV